MKTILCVENESAVVGWKKIIATLTEKRGNWEYTMEPIGEADCFDCNFFKNSAAIFSTDKIQIEKDIKMKYGSIILKYSKAIWFLKLD